MPIVTIRETYDLSTTTNKIGVLGIHTPGVGLLKKLYPGLLINYKKMRPVTCNVALACASMLPADPLQVGVESGEIAPQDLFNPILYRAVSTDSFNTILNRVYSFSDIIQQLAPSIANISSLGHSGNVGSDPFPTISSQEDAYYALLSESGWAKAMPQSGLSMRHLVPLVHYIVNTFGNVRQVATGENPNFATVGTTNATGSGVSTSALATTFRGKAIPMPSIPTIWGMTTLTASSSDSPPTWTIPVGQVNDIPKTWVACIVMPPSKLHKLYFRMTISWTVEFSELCTTVERGTLTQISEVGAANHAQDYTFDSGSSKLDEMMDVHESTVDTIGVDANMIMQS